MLSDPKSDGLGEQNNCTYGGGIGRQLVEQRHSLAPVLERLCRSRSGTFVDVGANIGAVLVELLRVDHAIPYIGFEPLLRGACHIQRIIELNGLDATHVVFPIALAETSGTKTLLLNEYSDVSATTSQELRPASMYARRTQVVTDIGDKYLRDIDQISVIKIDVEGAELSVLKGLNQTIAKHRPALVLEIMPFYHLQQETYDRAYFGHLSDQDRLAVISERQRNMAEIQQLMQAIGYDMFQYREGGLQPAKPSDSTLTNYDFVALRSEGSAGTGVFER